MTIRKILSLALALVMVCSMVVVGVYADPVVIPNTGKAPQQAGTTPAGRPADATNVTYLSDLHNADDALALNDYIVDQLNGKVTLDVNYNGDLLAFDGAGGRKQIKAKLEADGTRTLANGVSYKPTDIAVGYNGIKYEKGLGVHPDAAGSDDRYIVYNVKGLGNHFYAVAGATGYNVTEPDTNKSNRRVIFELWGSKADEYSAEAEFEKLAYVDQIRAYIVGEFDIDITGYNYIKLVVKMNAEFDGTNNSCAVVWADASLYSLPGTDASEPDASEPDASEPGNESEPSTEPTEEVTEAPTKDPNKATANFKPTAGTSVSGTDISVDSLVVDSYVYPAPGSTDPRKVNVDAAFKGAALTIGGETYTQGFGLHPSPANNPTESFVLLDISSIEGNRFYSKVGITGNAKDRDDIGVIFRVYGGYSKDGEFTLLASSGALYGSSVGEFNVWVDGYKYLKLEVDTAQSDNSSSAAAWVDTVIFTGEPSPTGDTFSALPVALLLLSGAAVAVIIKKKEN